MKTLDITILYVEDDEDIAQEVIYFLKSRVKELFVAKDGKEGLEQFLRYHPDMVITDVQMPRMNGLEMIKMIREEDPEVPVVVTSAYSDSDFLLESLNLGVDGYLLKPLDFKNMFMRITKLAEPLYLRRRIRELNSKLIKTNASLEAEIAKTVQKHTRLLVEENESIQKKAFYDSLTGLPNRAFIYELLEKKLKNAKRNKSLFALFFIDIDNFKVINDTFGHGVGDEVLIKFANRIKHSIRESDQIGRLGGDEFLLIASNIQNCSDGNILAEKILGYMEKDFKIEDISLDVTCSIGISCYPKDADNMSDLIKDADIAMYAIKRAGKCGIKFFKKE